MSETLNARIPLRVEQKLAEYCTKQGITRTEAVILALDHYLDKASGGPDAYTLAADVIPRKGAKGLQSDRVRELAHKAFRGKRSR